MPIYIFLNSVISLSLSPLSLSLYLCLSLSLPPLSMYIYICIYIYTRHATCMTTDFFQIWDCFFNQSMLIKGATGRHNEIIPNSGLRSYFNLSSVNIYCIYSLCTLCEVIGALRFQNIAAIMFVLYPSLTEVSSWFLQERAISCQCLLMGYWVFLQVSIRWFAVIGRILRYSVDISKSEILQSKGDRFGFPCPFCEAVTSLLIL